MRKGRRGGGGGERKIYIGFGARESERKKTPRSIKMIGDIASRERLVLRATTLPQSEILLRSAWKLHEINMTINHCQEKGG